MTDTAALDEAMRCEWVWKRVCSGLSRHLDGRVHTGALRSWMVDDETRQLIYVAYRRVVEKKESEHGTIEHIS